MTKCCLDHRAVQGRSADGINALAWIDIIGCEMERAGFLVDHPASHGNGVTQNFVRYAELLEGVNAARRKGEIDGTSAHKIARTRVRPPFEKVDFVSAPAEVGGEQTAGEAAANQNELRHGASIDESGKQESRKLAGSA